MADMYSEYRDMRCAADVGRMAALGRFDVEFQVYGCAYLAEDKMTYRVSPEAGQIYTFAEQCAHEGLYPTAIASYTRRTPSPSGMREQLSDETKLALAQQLHRTYPRSYFTKLQIFAETAANDSGYPLLRTLAEAIDGRFDEGLLQLLSGAMQMAYEAKLLTDESFAHLQSDLDKTRRQMEGDPIIEDNFSRTLYGFCYANDGGSIACTLDAQPVTIWERRAQLEASGALVAPILQHTYWFGNFDALPAIRQDFRRYLLAGQDAAYFQLLHSLKSLPGVIHQPAFAQALEALKKEAPPEAVDDFLRYGRRWNVQSAALSE